MMRRRGSLIVGVAMLLALGAASATDALTGPAAPVTTSASEQTVTSGVGESEVHGDITSGRILFVTERHGPEVHDLRVLAPDGLTSVETADGTFANVVWAGGYVIVFDSERAGPRHIFRQEDYRGGDPIQLLVGTDDGDQRAGSRRTGRRSSSTGTTTRRTAILGIWIVPSVGGVGTQVTPAGEEGTTSGATYTSFSPDDSEVVYARIVDWEDPIVGGVFVVDASGGTPRRITPDVVGLGMPRFSPDGTRILFSQYVADEVDDAGAVNRVNLVYLIRPDAGRRHRHDRGPVEADVSASVPSARVTPCSTRSPGGSPITGKLPIGRPTGPSVKLQEDPHAPVLGSVRRPSLVGSSSTTPAPGRRPRWTAAVDERRGRGGRPTDYVSSATEADRLGYDSFWLTEHHFQHEGYEVVPNVCCSVAVLAERNAARQDRLDVQHRPQLEPAAVGGGLRHDAQPVGRPWHPRRGPRHRAAVSRRRSQAPTIGSFDNPDKSAARHAQP